MLELEATERKRAGKRALVSLRDEGFMPAVIYGRKEKTASIKISQHDFKKVFKMAGESSIVSIKGLGDEKQVLIHDVDFDPVTSEPRHVDFYTVEKDKKISVKVPLEFTHEAPAVKELGGILVKTLHELEIEVLPKDLPHSIEVDISSIKDFETSLYVRDIALPEGVVTLVSPNEAVASVAEAKEEIEEEKPAADIESIEVEAKGKQAPEEEGGENKESSA
ncbi:50S ribosomal protein L25 [Patescibacteria group bacterium]|nr:50S ribosomal protein L25 [Patescibacteria group bacterium]